MKYCNTLDLTDFKDIELVSKYDAKQQSVVKYFNIECGFDIETTSTTINNEEKFAFMYEWTFGIKDKNNIYYGRTWKEFLTFCKKLKNHFNLSKNKILVVYIHNFAFEFQFMRKYFNWLNVFATDERKPVKALCDLGIEFRDSYILSGYSLDKLADNLVSHTIKKLKGDLDYSLIRTAKTPLTDEELMYCNNDVEIILCYINEQIQQYGNIIKIPMTNTGRVRRFVKDSCYNTHKNNNKSSKGKYKRYRELMKELTLTKDQYIMLKRCFMGGFTHASMEHSGKLLENVSSIDFTSSYPAVMLSEKFPMSKPIKIPDITKVDFKKLMLDENIGLMFNVRFIGLHSKLTYETYLSESKCFKKENAIINNGRIFSGDIIETTMTDIDFKIMQKCYTWEKIQFSNVYQFYMQYLPKPILESVIDLYQKKTTLKGVKGKEVEYMVSKGMLNSIYGMTVTDIIRNEISYEDDWNVTVATEDEMEKQIEKHNESKSRFLYYAWGVWVTAYARKNLWNGILNIKDDYIYSDTDSIKFLNYEKHKDYIDWYNDNIQEKLKRMCEFRKIDFELMKPKTIKGKEKIIGVWDYEGTYSHFKTLGAKRYLVRESDELHLTVAGLSKQNGIEYLNKKYKNDYLKVFNAFNDELYIPADKTGKMTHTYIDEIKKAEITDYLGNKSIVASASSIHLSNCDFTLSISKQYSSFLNDLKNGYLFTGVKAI